MDTNKVEKIIKQRTIKKYVEVKRESYRYGDTIIPLQSIEESPRGLKKLLKKFIK